uniref:NADH dehydrogenase subunit 2 n=1 Tax=Neohydnus jiuzhaigouensis TaxID=3028310 RepID=UPI0023D84A83|nr:NADH dehydrogenase subunit 2 [Neohydnus jiuzhaigouensis]WDE20713.1 NADH dehydrogenase subunit 2 [Neohydnus jiuzhaigouensis]
MKFYKLLFFLTMILGTLISISSYSWLGMWIGLEINLISIIPLFSKYNNMYSSEASIKYFLTQTLASMLILVSIISLSLSSCMFLKLSMNFNLILNSALLTKMGSAPFHFWFPEVAEGLNWSNNLIILTWQKIAPMILIMYNSNISYFFFITILACMIISSIMGFNQISLRKILTFSSINHIGWMLSALLFSKMIWLIYFIIYSIITMNIILIFSKFKMYFINQLNTIFNQNSNLKNFFIMNFFSLGGIPPFIGFLPKWLVINNLVNNKQFFLVFLMIMFTLITFYFYMRIMFSSLIMNFNTPILKQNSMNNFTIIFFNFASLSGLLIFPLFWNFM